MKAMEEEKYYPWEVREMEFEAIAATDNAALVTDVSKLRHYVNCHGKTKKLQEWTRLTKAQLSEVVQWCTGRTTIEELRTRFLELIQQRKEEEKRKREAERKNRELTKQLHEKRENMCGVGTRKVKLLLNKMIKQGDKIAELYRIALETEDYNIKAKETLYYYQDKVYRKKHEYILKLVDLCRSMDVVHGWQSSDVHGVNAVMYFDLPGVEQISFHTAMTEEEKNAIPTYPSEWDGKRLSTLWKLEEAIKRKYFDEKVGN